jgi:CNT family concentrative nucleoside transporter
MSPVAPTPWVWRLAIGVVVVALAAAAYWLQQPLGPRGQAALGVVCFLGVAAFFSSNLRAVSLQTLLWGIGLQIGLVLFIDRFEIGGFNPGRWLFQEFGAGIVALMGFTKAGSSLVFGSLGGDNSPAPFAFVVLPVIIFIASFFSVLYYFGVLQFIVRALARVMVYLLGTSGAETLSVSANIFIGQTEAPLIIKPYIPRMTESELLTMMVGGMAHISGSLMAVYINMGGQPEAILATSVMAAPGSLYLSKLMMPELGQPETRGHVKASVEQTHVNVIDAAASGASDGLRLALNVAAMLIAFLAFIALFNALLGQFGLGVEQAWQYLGLQRFGEPDFHNWSLERLFSWVFAPVAVLMGVDGEQNIRAVAELLGKKLVANEFMAYMDLETMLKAGEIPRGSRANILATYALTGFANFSSIAIQIGGIGALAPTRRHDLARLGLKALLTGFLVTLINAAIAGLLLTFPESR